ncbi:unnamed protein product [Clonostachys chloroleuca]|uniref:Peptidase S1 domain-containing protein n=1 Tax=Clonostachys chloroleuca TaxID=1926264 RepID=A0AA35QFH9_9HYPO|nr:unnamed protein product [Clonostachys chloroleuca]
MVSKVAAAALLALPALTMGGAIPREEASILIVGGSPASAGQFPYIVTVTTDSTICGGVLIGANTVLTASHCTFNQDGSQTSPSVYTIRAGSLQWQSGGTTSKVSSITRRSDYNPATTDNDVAILHLSSAIAESSNIGYATLAAAGSDPSGSITVAGWGLTSENGSLSANLRYVSVPVIDRAECAADYSGINAITDNMFCAGLQQGGKDACSGDSGGPVLTEDGTLAGVVSWGVGCARAGYPGVYTRLANYIDWINQNI